MMMKLFDDRSSLLPPVSTNSEFERGPLDLHLSQLDTAVSNLCLKISVVRVKPGQETEEEILGAVAVFIL